MLTSCAGVPIPGGPGREGRASFPLAYFGLVQQGCCPGSGRSPAEALRLYLERGVMCVTMYELAPRWLCRPGRGQEARAMQGVTHPLSSPLLASLQQFIEPSSCGSESCPGGTIVWESVHLSTLCKRPLTATLNKASLVSPPGRMSLKVQALGSSPTQIFTKVRPL